MYRMGQQEIDAVTRIIRDGHLFRYRSGGETETDRFERAWAQAFGVQHALAVNSGTSALVCALVGVGVEPGDEVIVPGYTFMATAMAPLLIGAVPVLADVDEGLMLDPEDVARKITPATKAIVPVHMGGHVADLAPLQQLARTHRIALVEDCCQCIGGSYRGRRVGAWGDAGAYSFNFFKIISCGEGGAVVMNDETTFQRARILHDSGCAWRPDAQNLKVPLFAGQNMRFDEIKSAIMRVQLERLDGILADLRARHRALREAALAEGLDLAPVHDLDGITGHQLFVRLPDRAHTLAFSKAATEAGVAHMLPHDSGRHVYANWEPLLQRRGAYHPQRDPLHTTPAGRARRYAADLLPRTIENLGRVVAVHVQIDWTDDQVRETARRLGGCLEKATATVPA